MHLTQLLGSSAYHDRSRWAERVLEVSAVYDENGGAYASRLKGIATRMIDQGRSKGKSRSMDSGVRLVLENVVEHVLLHLRNSMLDSKKKWRWLIHFAVPRFRRLL